MQGYGLVYSDDQQFGNDYSTDLRFPDGSEEHLGGQRPEHYFGVSALVSYTDDEFHLMGEDDGHFWTNAILTAEECRELREVITKISETVELKPKWKYKVKRSFRDEWSHDKFPAKVEKRNVASPLVSIKVKDTEIQFDIFWALDYIKTLTIKD